MPSPFPGMDPFLEDPGQFPALHGALITAVMSQLQRTLPEGYLASADERVWIGPGGRNVEPDANVLRRESAPAQPDAPSDGPGAGDATLVAAATAPVVVVADHDPHRERFVEIRSRAGGQERVVAVLEILSPSNKARGPGRDSYLAKQHDVLGTRQHLIEVDLLRAGQPTTALPDDDRAQVLRDAAYHACVARGDIPNRYEVYPIPLRNPLPRISIPLEADTPPIALDLQAAFDRAYDDGPFRRRNLYADLARIAPPLPPDAAAWATDLLKDHVT
ncbi:DUF4058 family protein [Alienimonas californiensis]|uniref:DUF4058 domain-containing protein n=1 Tax=Alienimonas californiensis TaxID=2527989 RepID=A0A517P3X7_9PLAN|nr:DUF4058 family protein [Alienimonas californiensis]QDT14079.1 hypothetical protein CA12_01470 [Alienimonas californiensis]